MMDIKPLSRELGSAIDQVVCKFQFCNFEDLSEQLRHLEEGFAPRIGSDLYLLTELKRRIAEAQFHAAVAKKIAFDECKATFDKLCELGFTHRHGENTYRIIFAERCLQAERFTEGLRLLRPLEEEGGTTLNSRDRIIVRKLLRKLRQKTI